MTIADALFAATGAGLSAIVVWRRDMMVHRHRDRSLWLALALLAVAVPLYIGPIYRAVEGAVGIIGSAAVLRHGIAVLAALAVLVLVSGLSGVPTSRRRTAEVGLCILALTVMTVPFVVAPPAGVGAALVGRTEYYDATWRSGVHWAAYLAYMAWAVGGAAVFCHRLLVHAAPGPVRSGLILVRAGTGTGLIYLFLKACVVVAWITGFGPSTVAFDYPAEVALLSVALSLIAVGSAYEAVARQARRALTWARLVRTLWTLYPLWQILQTNAPHITRLPPEEIRRLDLAPLDTLSIHLVDRAVEIRDGLLDLRAYAPAAARDRAERAAVTAGEDERSATAIAEAVGLAIALHAKAAGDAPRPDPAPVPGDTSLLDETEWLERVAIAYQRSPLVPLLAGLALASQESTST